jgi:hypothetical protein
MEKRSEGVKKEGEGESERKRRGRREEEKRRRGKNGLVPTLEL